MGKKAKSSRKGKKAWRANIPTDDIEEFFEKSTKDALSGGSVANVSNDSLFIVDKSRGNLNSETLTHLSSSFLGFFFLFHFLLLCGGASHHQSIHHHLMIHCLLR